MSHNTVIETQFTDLDTLAKALVDMVPQWKGHVQVSEKGFQLYGYEGKTRPQVAAIRIDRHLVGGASNDLGFVRQADGTLSAVISDYDSSRYNNAWLGRLKQAYGLRVVDQQIQKQGQKLLSRQTLPDGRIRLVVEV